MTTKEEDLTDYGTLITGETRFSEIYTPAWVSSSMTLLFIGGTSSILSTPAYGNDVELGIDTRSRDSGGSSVFITHTSRLLTTIPMHDNNSSPYSGADMERGTLKRVGSAQQ